jgi:hypothetical protein
MDWVLSWTKSSFMPGSHFLMENKNKNNLRSIGGFSAAWTAAQFPGIKALIMDACFDDLVPLAASKLPSALDSIVRYSVRKHLDMPVSKMVIDLHICSCYSVLMSIFTDDQIPRTNTNYQTME